MRLRGLVFAFALVAACPLRAAPGSPAQMDDKHRPFLESYCVECHGPAKHKGKVRLDDISTVIDTVERAELWQKVLNQINSGDMPPEEAKQPGATAKADFLEALSSTMVTARKTLGDAGGKITMRRLNRREYKNTIRELLGVDLRVNELPADGGAGTFDTVGAALFMSSDQIEQYLALGRQAIDEHLARFGAASASSTPPRQMHLEVEEKNAKIAAALRQRIDAHERYEKWVAASQGGNAVSPKDFGFTDAVHAEEQGHRNWLHYVPHHRAYVEDPATKTGAFLTIEDVYVNPYQAFRIPGDWAAGDYVVRVRIAATGNTPKERHFVEFGSQDDSGVRAVISSHQITGTMEKPQILEIPLTFSPANGHGFFFQEKGSYASEGGARQIFDEALKRNGIGPEFALWLDWIEVASVNAAPKVIRERREVELHANAMVGGTYNGYYKGGNEAAKRFLETGQPQKGIADEQEAKFRVRVFGEHGPSFERYLNDPLTKTGAYLTIYNVHPEEVITLPPDQPSGWMETKHEVKTVPPGEYQLRFRIGAVKDSPAERHFVELGARTGKDEFGLIQTFQITGTIEDPQTIEFPVAISADGPRSFVLREKRDVKLDHDWYKASTKDTGFGPPSVLWVDWVEWEGPLHVGDQPGIEPILPAGSRDARGVIERFAVRAFRDKAPGQAFIDKLTAMAKARLAAGEPLDLAIREPLSVILASPGFLYLAEPGEEKKPRPLTDLELATRLSYFLWSAPPDGALLTLARTNELHKPEVVAREVDRLIADPRSDEFVRGFVPQWLGMERLDFFQFDTKQFRDFDESAKTAARREVYETFEHLMRSGASLSRLLKSDEVYVNGLLATYYGIDGVTGDEFQRVALPAASPRGGLLGMAAILAMGSNGERTSPVERGAWILRKLLHDPPPPAPPNVPQLDRLAAKPLSARERLLAHQEEPQCAQCHRKIDPIGFGLENFNAAGKWREVDHDPKSGKDFPIDPRGAFYKGPAFADYFALRDLIASDPRSFARGFTEALIEYALGRPYGFKDAPLVEEILTATAAKEFALKEFFRALVVSDAFQSK
jgi:hypothetical protein